MNFTIDNQTETTLNELIQANELDQNTINELINLKVNESYFIGICEIKKLGSTIKTYKLMCSNFGWKFSFNADNEETAVILKNDWCRYQSFDSKEYTIEETTNTNRIHNEYM